MLNDIDEIHKSTKKWNTATGFVREAILEKYDGKWIKPEVSVDAVFFGHGLT
jgi:hypothetical protein